MTATPSASATPSSRSSDDAPPTHDLPLMLRVADQWYGSDVGRQRQGNEDKYFVRSPLFVGAGGMGGAQAGEVASELAVEAFRDGLPDGAPENGLVGTIREA